ncbi:gamma-glutamyl hydrolase-like [Colletes latitarsis]|uniref:gamma-glutamyl hydrolase-like n=1 Tax=Colletes latitarsis TaxID=2605962 RepID=UPI004035E062
MSAMTPTFIILLTFTISSFVRCVDDVNNRPIIGILMQELNPYMSSRYSHYNAYIAASYVKLIEGSGARVAPIWIGRNQSYYRNIMKQINGILWPGGSAPFKNSKGYADAGDTIYKIAKKMNDKGDYFPIFGICLGFELLTYVTDVSNRTKHRTPCSADDIALPLEFTNGYKSSKMFADASADIKNILATKSVTVNSHHFCVTQNDLKRSNIFNEFRILSVNHDKEENEFISSLESVNYPFYGLQFHPEKNLYEWKIGHGYPHSANAVRIAQYFGNFFVSEARKNCHTFSSEQEEISSLIYNYKPTYTGLNDLRFVQCYFFK